MRNYLNFEYNIKYSGKNSNRTRRSINEFHNEITSNKTVKFMNETQIEVDAYRIPRNDNPVNKLCQN